LQLLHGLLIIPEQHKRRLLILRLGDTHLAHDVTYVGGCPFVDCPVQSAE